MRQIKCRIKEIGDAPPCRPLFPHPFPPRSNPKKGCKLYFRREKGDSSDRGYRLRFPRRRHAVRFPQGFRLCASSAVIFYSAFYSSIFLQDFCYAINHAKKHSKNFFKKKLVKHSVRWYNREKNKGW